MIKIRNYIMLAFIAIFTSCSYEIEDQDHINEVSSTTDIEKLTVNEYMSLIKQQTSLGSVLIQSYDYPSSNFDIDPVISISEKKLRNGSSGNFYIDFPKYPSIDYNTSSNSDLSPIYGTNINYRIINKLTQDIIEKSVYVPKLLDVDFSSESIQTGESFTWNVDNNNSFGLIVYITYNPFTQPDVNRAWELQQRRTVTAFTIEDSKGKYYFTEKDLERFPTGVNLTVNVIRGAYSYNKDKPSFVAFTKASRELIRN